MLNLFGKRKTSNFIFIVLSILLLIPPYKEIIGQQKIISVKHPAWSYNQTIYEVNVRQYTASGTFKRI